MNDERLRQVLHKAVAARDVAGVAAAVTGPQTTMAQACAGVSAIGGAQPVDERTVFWIASMTKPVTSVAAMQLVEAGKLALDAPAKTWLPELEHPQILENGRLRPAARDVTLRHLLAHTSGFSYPFASAEYAAYLKALPEPPAQGTRAALNLPLLFEPGERWAYGLGTDWVGLAVEAASGESLASYFERHIFTPLGMTDTGFLPNEEQIGRCAWMHRREADGGLAARPPAPPRAPPAFFSGGSGLFSTLADYQKFLRLFLNRGAGILAPETVAEMARNQIGALRAGHMPSVNPALLTGTDVNPGQPNKWGLGFLIYPQTGPFGRSAGSLAWSGMANTYFWIDPALNLAAVILMQILPAGDVGALKTYSRFEKAVYAAPS